MSYTWFPAFVWQIENGEEPNEQRALISKEEACEELRKAMKGFGTDEKSLTYNLADRSAEERYYVIEKYEEMYGHTLEDEINSETSGDYGRALKYMALGPVDSEAKMIYNVLHKGIKKRHLVPLLVGRSNSDLTLIKKTYYKNYDKDMIVELTKQLSGDFKQLIVMCANGIEEEYNPDTVHTEDRVQDDVKAFYKAGEGKWGTDEKAFFKILVVSPAEHLKEVNAAYSEEYGNTLKKAVKKETGGEVQDALFYLLNRKLGKTPQAIAAEIKKCTRGLGSDKDGLMNLIIRLSFFPDLLDAVKEAHKKLYKKSLVKRVKSETGGNLRLLLVTTIANCRGLASHLTEADIEARRQAAHEDDSSCSSASSEDY